jgi:hypothetical protein
LNDGWPITSRFRFESTTAAYSVPVLPNNSILQVTKTMLAWVVDFRLHSRLATLFRHVTKYPSPQVLPYPPLTDRDARKSSRICSYENCRVSLPPQTLKPSICQCFLAYLLPLHALANSFALIKNSTLFFSSKSELFCKNTRGWGTPAFLKEDQMNHKTANSDFANVSARARPAGPELWRTDRSRSTYSGLVGKIPSSPRHSSLATRHFPLAIRLFSLQFLGKLHRSDSS